KQAYDWQSERLGAPTEYTQLGSLHPELVYERLRMYKTVEEVKSGLTEIEVRLVVFLTSELNATPHCSSGARAKLGELGVADDFLAALLADPEAPNTGNARLDAIASYTTKLTVAPGSLTGADIDRLRGVGLDDADIVALNNLSAYYNYTNRVATGLGLRSEIPWAHALGAAPR
ncbi:MAG TPA: hypothetical protein VKD67_10770, partial [Acidimicrobiales bacterium]|nr:hypothetical protein [Acidimicrobiales bacterium]